MSLQPQRQKSSRALARGSAGGRPAGAPAYFLGRPASVWLNATGLARQVRRTQAACG
jgi:hypothetical protein